MISGGLFVACDVKGCR